MSSESTAPSHFIRQIIAADVEAGRNGGQVVTRFPPEPNGYLHIGHAKSICLNFGMALEFSGSCHLRMDDTNPEKEDVEYVDSIRDNVQWLGFQWAGPVRFASEYFDQLYQWALELIRNGKAYVCHLNGEEMRSYRGTLTEPGRPSPWRDRSVEENLAEFARMTAGEYDEGAATLRARIDMSSPNINLRDPIIYRVRKVPHHHIGDKWCIYPMYDFAHGLSDAIEGITHSICTLEFEDHRPLYDWFLDNVTLPGARPRQYEFARLNLNYTITSKRKLKRLVDEQRVSGWDDPRMPTIAGLRRRGYTPTAIRHFCELIGVTRSDGIVDVAMLEFAIREDLDANAPRAMCVLRPLKVVIENYPEGQTETLRLPCHPKTDMGEREITFEREIYLDREDFAEVPPSGWKRLTLGNEIRLRGAYTLRVRDVVKNAAGEITELRAEYDPATLGKNPEGRKVSGVLHWVPANHALDAEVRLYDRLFSVPDPEAHEGQDFVEFIHPESLVTMTGCKVEPSLAGVAPEARFQFEREGYFVADQHDCANGRLVFNRTVGLKDSWGKAQK